MNCKGQWLCNRFATALQWRFALQSTSVVPFTIRIFPQHVVMYDRRSCTSRHYEINVIEDVQRHYE
jgi:hypothetical protein